MKPPKHLSADARRWWATIARVYALEPPHVRLLTLAAESWDRSRQARQELAAAGALTYRDNRGNLRPHPAVTIERDSRTAFASLLKQLALDADEPRPGPGRPTVMNSEDY